MPVTAVPKPLTFQVGSKGGRYVVTRFAWKIREFGLTSEEIDRYIEMLRVVQRALQHHAASE